MTSNGGSKRAARADRAARALARRLRGRAAAPAADGRTVQAERLIGPGLFDRDYYEAQTGATFASDLDAARHALESAADQGLTFHPLVEPDYLPEAVRTRWAKGKHREVLDALTTGGVAPGPLFDPGVWLEQHPAAAADPAGPFGHFLRVATAATVLPVPRPRPGRAPTYGEARAELLRRARDYARAEARSGRRAADRFTADAEWQRRWSTAPSPRFEDRPVVTVVLPAVGRDDAAAIVSVQGQTTDDWELVVVGDDIAAGLRELAEADGRIRVVEAPMTTVAAAYDAGVAAARGAYLAFLDPAVRWEPDFLRLSLAALHGGRQRAGHAVLEIDRDGRSEYLAFEGGVDDLMAGNHVQLGTLVAETDLVREAGGFDPAFRRAFDHDLVLRLAKRTELTLLPFLGARARPSGDVPNESGNWEFAAVGKNLVDWDDLRAGLADRVTGRTSVLLLTFRDQTMTRAAVHAVRERADEAGDDVEIVVIDNGSQRSVSALLWAEFGGDDRITVTRLDRNYNFAGGCNAAFARSSGDRVVFLNNDTVVHRDWLRPLLAPLQRDDVLGTQPLLVFDDGTVQSAGSVFVAPGRIAAPFLMHHPVEDARRVDGTGFAAVTAAALAMRPLDVVDARGFDPLYANGMEDVDLCLRLRELRPGGSFEVVSDSVVTHLESKTPGRGTHIAENRRIFVERWGDRLPAPAADRARYRQLGFEVAAIGSDRNPVPAPRVVLARPGSAVLCRTFADVPATLRWSLSHEPDDGGPDGNTDESRAAVALGHGLRRRGQDAVTVPYLPLASPVGQDGGVAHLADVTVTVRGPGRSIGQAGAVNVLWVVDDPERVTALEASRYDLVCATSDSWARRATPRLRRPVVVLPLPPNDSAADTIAEVLHGLVLDVLRERLDGLTSQAP